MFIPGDNLQKNYYYFLMVALKRAFLLVTIKKFNVHLETAEIINKTEHDSH